MIFGVNRWFMRRYFMDDKPIAEQLGPVVYLKRLSSEIKEG
jgi:hypothetical protein